MDLISTHSEELQADELFSHQSRRIELSYRANRLGIFNRDFSPGINWWSELEIPISDEYLFARKYFPASRVLVALITRILTFHNPIKEITAFKKSAIVKKIILANTTPVPEGFNKFPFKFFEEKPAITVVIPTLNRYKHLANVLTDLEVQDYRHFDVIVVDQSDAFDPDFYKNYKLNIRVIRQEEKALWLARNTAIKNATGSFIALSEDDVRIPKSWLSNHLRCIEYYNADISNGIFFPQGESIPQDKNFFRWSDQFATGNAFLNKRVFLKTGLFDRQFEKQRMGDGEFGMRAYKMGVKSIMNPLAWCEDVKAATGGLRESGNWDAFRPKNIWSMRPVPSVLYFYRKYFGTKAALISLLIQIPPSIVPYRYKRNKKMLIAGSAISILLLPLIIFQVLRSWKKSTLMLNNPLIETFHE